ncbi:MAG: PilZ domain-containing protein [Actinomycetota bacterium]
MTAGAFHRAPLPPVGAEVWIEDLVGGPWPTEVVGHDGDLVRVAAPRLGHQRVLLPLGETFTLTYRDREVPCEAPAVLLAPAVAAGRGGDYLVRLEAPPVRVQRRGAVRVPIRMIVRAEARDVRGAQAQAILAGLTENLSADGALVRLEHPLTVGDVIDVAFQCGGVAGTIQATGVVVRCERRQTRTRPWQAAVTFSDIDRSDQDRLVRHLFERQRELRRREVEAV